MKCPKCGFEVPDNSKVCPQCKAKIGKKFPTWAIVLLIFAVLAVMALPVIFIIGIVAAMTIPTLVSETDSAKNKSQYKKSLATMNQALLMSEAMYDKKYSRADDVVNIAIKGSLAGSKDIPNGIIFADSSAIKYETTGNSCKEQPSNPSAHTACAIVTIDTNGFDNPPNKRTEKSSGGNVNDQFRVLLYSNSVVPEPGTIEEELAKRPISNY